MNLRVLLKPKFILLASTLALSGFLPHTSQAATIVTGATRDGGGILKLSGDIDINDGNQLRSLLSFAKANGIEIHTLELESPGGSLYDGMDLAVVVREANLTTRVMKDSLCASSCFTVYAAGTKREYEQGARIGVHSARHLDEGENQAAKSYTIDMMRFLDALGVPASILGKLAVTEPQHMTWLDEQDLRLMASSTQTSNYQNDNYVTEVAPQVKSEEKVRTGVTSSDAKHARELNTQAIKLIHNDRPDEAINLLLDANDLSPYDAEVLGNLGYALFLSSRFEEARDILALALRIKPERGSSWHNLGMALAFLEDADWATESLVNYYNYSSRKDLAQNQLETWIVNENNNPYLRQAALDAYKQLGLSPK